MVADGAAGPVVGDGVVLDGGGGEEDVAGGLLVDEVDEHSVGVGDAGGEDARDEIDAGAVGGGFGGDGEEDGGAEGRVGRWGWGGRRGRWAWRRGGCARLESVEMNRVMMRALAGCAGGAMRTNLMLGNVWTHSGELRVAPPERHGDATTLSANPVRRTGVHSGRRVVGIPDGCGSAKGKVWGTLGKVGIFLRADKRRLGWGGSGVRVKVNDFRRFDFYFAVILMRVAKALLAKTLSLRVLSGSTSAMIK